MKEGTFMFNRRSALTAFGAAIMVVVMVAAGCTPGYKNKEKEGAGVGPVAPTAVAMGEK